MSQFYHPNRLSFCIRSSYFHWKEWVLIKKLFTSALFLLTRRKKCPYSEFFWSVFSHIQTEYGEILSISQYSVRMWENADENNSEHGRFSCSVNVLYTFSFFPSSRKGNILWFFKFFLWSWKVDFGQRKNDSQSCCCLFLFLFFLLWFFFCFALFVLHCFCFSVLFSYVYFFIGFIFLLCYVLVLGVFWFSFLLLSSFDLFLLLLFYSVLLGLHFFGFVLRYFVLFCFLFFCYCWCFISSSFFVSFVSFVILFVILYFILFALFFWLIFLSCLLCFFIFFIFLLVFCEAICISVYIFRECSNDKYVSKSC